MGTLYVWARCSSPWKRLSLKEGGTAEAWSPVERPRGENVRMSEEMIFDPFISKTTGWQKVPDEQIDSYECTWLTRLT
jgi:hypothetical protein